jgi:hypothetical protein
VSGRRRGTTLRFNARRVDGCRRSRVQGWGGLPVGRRRASVGEGPRMSVAEEFVISKMALEIRYRDGVVYLDRCGSLLLDLQRVLGEPFKPSLLPTMEYGELRSNLERIVVRFGRENYIFDQTWLETPTRLQKLAPAAWAEIAKSLGVEKKVERCAIRTWLVWAVAKDEAEPTLSRCGAIRPTESWEQIMGKPDAQSYVGMSKIGGKVLRAELNGSTTLVEGRVWPDEEKFIPANSIQLSLDFSMSDPARVTADELKSFIASSVADTRKIATQMGGVFHAKSAD